MPQDEASPEWPDEGSVIVRWSISVIEGRRRLGWTYQSEPSLDNRQAILLLRDVADELELDLPE